MQKYLLFFPLLALALCGCNKDKLESDEVMVPRLMVETRSVQYGALGGNVVELPVSGTRIALQKQPLVTEFNIANVELVKVDMGLALLIQTDETGARALYRGTVSNMGGRIVLTVNNNAIGARRIDGAIQNGNFYTFVEVDDEELGQLVLDIKETLKQLQKR
jgi:hypothetical protein